MAEIFLHPMLVKNQHLMPLPLLMLKLAEPNHLGVNADNVTV
jgi:hypothetical protein